MWVRPQPDEGLVYGERVEVTGPILGYIRRRAAKLAARRRRRAKQGDFVAGHEARSVGWSCATRIPTESIKFYQGGLATEAVKNMYEGRKRRARCPCGVAYTRQRHGFINCELDNVCDTRTTLVEEVRDTLIEMNYPPGVADTVVAA